MSRRTKKNVLVMLANIGATSLEQNSLEDEPFIDKVKYAMRLLVEKKIFLQPKDEVGVITMGDETDNPNEVDNVKLYCEHLLVPNWEIIKYINSLEATNYACNWIEGLHVALQYILKEVVDPGCNIYLVIFNNFKEDESSIEDYDSNVIADQLNNYNSFRLLFVGEKSFEDLSASPTPSEKFVLDILKQTEAQYDQLNPFIENRKFYKAPPTNPMPWNFDLEWAGLSIPCSEFVKTTEGTSSNTWKMASSDANDLLQDSQNLDDSATSSANVVKHNIVLDNQREEVSDDNIITGYEFGGKIIPFSEEDEAAVRFEGTEKGIMIYGFVPQDEVKIEYWAGEGSRIVVPRSQEESTAFYSLVQAMVEKKYVAIVRKVYAKNSVPKMGVFFPKINDDEIWCLVHLEIPFAEELRYLDRVPIVGIEEQVSKEKLDAMDEFIDAMTLKDTDEVDYLNPGMFPNVRDQYEYNAIAERALKPNGPLLPINDYIKKYLEPPEILKIRAKPCIEKLDKAFEDCINSQKQVETKKSHALKTDEIKEDEPQVANGVSKGVTDEPVVNAIPNEKNSIDEGVFSGGFEEDLKYEDFEDF